MKTNILSKGLAVAVIILFIGLAIQPSVAVTSDDNSPPEKPDIIGPLRGRPGVEYDYSFVTTDPDGDDVSYFIDWGDGINTGWTDYIPSGWEILFHHAWDRIDTFSIRVKAKDIHGAEGEWSDFAMEIPRTRTTTSYHWLWERFPLLERLLSLLL